MNGYMNTKEVAEKLDIAVSTVTYYIRNNELKAIKLGKGYKITEEDLNDFIHKRKTKKS